MSTLTLNLAEAKARLSELTERVTHGDEVVITRHGKPVARIQKVREKARRVDVAAFRQATGEQAEQPSAALVIRELRDGARY
ncbi:MAG TPA: type II toxin-antitoxin system prevent-host-death family antitoxin [Xanthomonadaceae bacterium]|nr:type II toxin-antitoxin system prevent-host-death family antitoxin [Xanthomonadaceae bacterium]